MTRERLAGRFPELVSSLDEGDVDALLEALELRDADAGEALVAEGTPSDTLFLVLDGTLDVTMEGPVQSRVLARVEPKVKDRFSNIKPVYGATFVYVAAPSRPIVRRPSAGCVRYLTDLLEPGALAECSFGFDGAGGRSSCRDRSGCPFCV